MSLGLSVAGTYALHGNQKRPTPPAAWLDEVRHWLLTACEAELEAEPEVQMNEAGEPALYALLHPCAAPIEIIAPDGGLVHVNAMTTSVGPGYHQFVCSLMDRMAEELGITWRPQVEGESEDETGYFFGRDRANLEGAMLLWLQSVCRIVLEPGGMLDGNRAPDDAPPAVAMALGTTFLHGGDVTTPMGPRNRAWLEAVTQDPRRGIDFFAWWDEGQPARTLLRRAEAIMWSQVRWTPAVTEEDFEVQRRVADLLAEAYALDPSLPYPWREWAELMTLVEWEGKPREEVERLAAAVDPAAPLIGYLRGDVIVSLPGPWKIVLPGSLTLVEDDDGDFVVTDGRRTLRCSSLRLGDETDRPTMEQIMAKPPPLDAPNAEKLTPWTMGRIGGAGTIARMSEDGEDYWAMTAIVCTDGQLAILTFTFDREEDRQWAERAWRSVRFVEGFRDDDEAGDAAGH